MKSIILKRGLILFTTLAPNTAFASCETGSVRLQNGMTNLEGRLEVCINGAWGTVCERGFSSDDATVVCTSLGFYNGMCVCDMSMSS